MLGGFGFYVMVNFEGSTDAETIGTIAHAGDEEQLLPFPPGFPPTFSPRHPASAVASPRQHHPDPVFENCDIECKIADLGNACWTVSSYRIKAEFVTSGVGRRGRLAKVLTIT